MAKTTAPLLSFAAGGQIAKTQVYSSWKGIPYVRRYATPTNPNTSGQQETRSVFAWATQVWKLLAADATAPWTAYAKGQPLTNRNAFIRFAVKNLRGMTNLAGMLMSPGTGGAPPLTSISAGVSSDTITITPGLPTTPSGWTLTGVAATAIIDEDPSSSTVYTSVTAVASSSPWHPAPVVGGAGTYRCMAWPIFTNASGETVYGPSINTTAVVT